jgi:hypothetical protein
MAWSDAQQHTAIMVNGPVLSQMVLQMCADCDELWNFASDS